MTPGRIPSASALHVIDTAGPGGAETVFADLASKLDGKPLRSLTIIPREAWLADRLRMNRLDPIILPAKGSLNVAYLRHLVRIARTGNVRLLHTHLLGSAVYGVLAGELLRLPVLSVFHGPVDVAAPGRHALLKRLLLRRASRLVAVSNSTLEALEAFGLPRERITLIPNGIDTAAFVPERRTELRDELGLGASDFLVGAVGNVRAPKAYDVLLATAAEVVKHAGNVHFAVAGDGSVTALEPLLRLRDRLGLASRFHFVGFRRADNGLFGNFDLFVSSSRSEGLPLSFLEAMACGLCVVATASGGAQEVIRNTQTGLLVPIEDPPALAASLLTVIRDHGLRSRLAEEGRALVLREFSLDSAVHKYERLYGELLSNGR